MPHQIAHGSLIHFVAKKGQTFSKIRQGKIDRSVSLNQIESGVLFSTNSTDACGAKSGGATGA
ncbi:MAG TPA: hypothetical protein VIS99_01500 [Terrimicrobiaceae bacterium]